MFDPEFQRKALSLVMGFIMQFSKTPTEPEVQELSVNDLNVSTISVSCLKVTWDSDTDRDYTVSCTAHDDDYACYFERAKMKRDAARLAKKPRTPKDQTKGRSKKQGIE